MTDGAITRRTAIAGIAGAAGAGGVSAAQDAKLPPREVVTAAALGITGDGSKADADRAQRAFETAAREFRTIHFCGQREWRFATSLMLFGSEDRGSSVLRGEGAYSTVLHFLDEMAPAFINDQSEPDFRRLSMRGLTIRGGSHGILLRRTGDEVASLLDLSDVRFEFQREIGLYCEQYLIASSFVDTVFYYCNRGIACGRNANNLLFQKARFEGLNDRAVEFSSPGGGVNGCEDVRFVSCRFEGRNGQSRSDAFVIGGYRLSTLTVESGYFEDTHRTILRERGGLGQSAFKNCHFSGQLATEGKLQSEIFDADAIVAIEGSRFVQGAEGPRHVLVSGVNRGLKRRHGWYTAFGGALRYATPLRRVGHQGRLASIAWTGWSASEERRGALLSGRLQVTIRSAGVERLGFDLVVESGREGALCGRLTPLNPSPSGVGVAIGRSGQQLDLILSGAPADAAAMIEIDAVVDAPGEPPFLLI